MALPSDFQQDFDRFRPHTPDLKVLEAGGGSTSHLSLPEQAHITTIDISQDQLDRNTYAHKKVRGDLETFDFGGDTFDIIICWDVIEHLNRPQKALDNMMRALRPNGILVLGAPMVNSAKGIITKFTPHRLHVLAYKFLLRSTKAGLPGHPPFPTYLRFSIAPHRLKDHLEKHKKDVVFVKQVQSLHVDLLYRKSVVLWGLFKAFSMTLTMMTLGYVNASSTDFMMIAKEPS